MQSVIRYLGCDPELFDRKRTSTDIGFRLNYFPLISGENDSTAAGLMLGYEDVDLFYIFARPKHGMPSGV